MSTVDRCSAPGKSLSFFLLFNFLSCWAKAVSPTNWKLLIFIELFISMFTAVLSEHLDVHTGTRREHQMLWD